MIFPKLRKLILKDELGETIVETLVSILIGTLALLMLATAISSSVRMIMNSRVAMNEHYGKESALADPLASSDVDSYDAKVELVEKDSKRSVFEETDVRLFVVDEDTGRPLVRYVPSSNSGGD